MMRSYSLGTKKKLQLCFKKKEKEKKKAAYISEGHTNKDWSGTFLFMTIDLSAIVTAAELEIT